MGAFTSRPPISWRGDQSNTFNVILSSSLYGELKRRSASTSVGAYAVAVKMLGERSADEVCTPAMHGETIGMRIEGDDGGAPS